MTKGITDMLNLPELEEVLGKEGISLTPSATPSTSVGVDHPDDAFTNEKMAAILSQAEKRMANASGEDHAQAMDALHEELLKHSRDLIDLGYNIDHARARGIFEVAASMYKNAIDAKNSKRDAQLKAMKIALDQRKLDLEEQRLRLEAGERETVTSDAIIVEDRNDLIRRIRAQIKNGEGDR